MKTNKFIWLSLAVLALIGAVFDRYRFHENIYSIYTLLDTLVLALLVGFINRVSSRSANAYTIKGFCNFSMGKLLPLLGLFILVSVVIAIGIILLVIPGIYLSLALALSFPALLVGDKAVIDACKTSFELMKGRMIAYLLCFVLPSTALSMILFSIVAKFPLMFDGWVGSFIITLAANTMAIFFIMIQFGFYKKLAK